MRRQLEGPPFDETAALDAIESRVGWRPTSQTFREWCRRGRGPTAYNLKGSAGRRFPRDLFHDWLDAFVDARTEPRPKRAA